MTNNDGHARKTIAQWQMWAIAVVLSILVGFMGVSWQTAIAVTEFNTKEIGKIEEQHRIDIARLDETNRVRRNDIAELEARIAVLEERTS